MTDHRATHRHTHTDTGLQGISCLCGGLSDSNTERGRTVEADSLPHTHSTAAVDFDKSILLLGDCPAYCVHMVL